MHTHQKTNISVTDSFIRKFAERYLAQRSQTNFDYATLNQSSLYGNLDFDTSALQKILERNAVVVDVNRERGVQPAVLNDIYRSDLGELLILQQTPSIKRIRSIGTIMRWLYNVCQIISED